MYPPGHDPIHVEFLGFHTSPVPGDTQERPAAGSNVMQVYGQPLAFDDSADQAPPVVGKRRGRGPHIGEVLVLGPREPIHHDRLGKMAPEFLPRAPVAGIQVGEVPTHNVITGGHDPILGPIAGSAHQSAPGGDTVTNLMSVLIRQYNAPAIPGTPLSSTFGVSKLCTGWTVVAPMRTTLGDLR